MVDSEKQENLANARRKLKKFRDQQQRQNGSDYTADSTRTNGNELHLINGTFNEPVFNHQTRSRSEPQNTTSFVEEQQAILNGLHVNLSKSPVADLEEQNRQFALLIENQKQQRARLEDQRQYGVNSSMSGRSSQNQFDNDSVRQLEQKYRRDFDHLQEQLDIHVQTIGILVAEKTDLSAKLTQTIKQLERKQSETEEIQGRLKASRERIDELERHTQNSSSTVQKQEIAAKESDKELERLRAENNRQNQTIEDLKQNLTELENKFKHRQTVIDQLNGEISKLKQKVEQSDIRLQQYQSVNDTSLADSYEQRTQELQQTIQLKSNEIEALLSSINQMRSDNDQTHLQYQQYNANVQRHIQELNEQMRQLIETNSRLENEQEAMRKSYEMKLNELQNHYSTDQNSITNDLLVERDSLRQEVQSFKPFIDQWSTKIETMQIDNERLTTEVLEKDQRIAQLEETIGQLRDSTVDHDKLLQSTHDDKTTLSRAMAQNKQLKEQLFEIEDRFVKMSNDNMNLTNQIQAQEHLNKQLKERLTHHDTSPSMAVNESSQESPVTMPQGDAEMQQLLMQRLKDVLEENNSLKERLTQFEQQNQTVVEKQANESGSLSSLQLHEEESSQSQNGYLEKIIDRFNRAMRDNADLHDRTQQLEHLILQLQSETDTIGDYISLYQQQRQQLHRRYQEKDEYIKHLTQDRLNLQRKLSELETLLMRGLNKPPTSIPMQNETPTVDSTETTSKEEENEHEWLDMLEEPVPSSSTDNKTTVSTHPSVTSLADFDNDTKIRIITLLQELGGKNLSSKSDQISNTKLAFIGKNLYVCSTCSGPVQWV